MEDSRLSRSMLLDFYGELLTDKQRECFDLHYNEDLSLSEIAEQLGISRQGVWDNIRRAETVMQDVERKTGLMGLTERNRRALETLRDSLRQLTELCSGRARDIVESALSQADDILRRMGTGGGEKTDQRI